MLAGPILASLAGCAFLSPGRGMGCVPDGGRIGPWTVESTGFGCVQETEEGWLQASTMGSAIPSETHAFLLTGPRAAAPFTLSARMNTVAHNRAGSTASNWETAWLVWNFTDRKHFYYFAAKRDGWELGKRDPAYRGGQRFLVDGKSPSFPLGEWATVQVTQTAGHRMTVQVDGVLVADFTDSERPYGRGRIGLYGEDCSALFDGVSVVRD